jgi:2-polyprenyl-6-methoxyphenol hydroxylase-like FAD-dependent oxidoreductase
MKRSEAAESIACDVAIVGYGPVGQALAALLGQRGHRVAVLERWQEVYPLPRACVMDHEGMRLLQGLGIADAFHSIAIDALGEYLWTNARGQTLYHFKYPRPGVSGWSSRFAMCQPELEQLLCETAQAHRGVSVHRGYCFESLQHEPQGAVLFARQADPRTGQPLPDGARLRVHARFVVGCDGANSPTRQAAGLPWRDLGFRAEWLVVDFRPHDIDMPIDIPAAGQLCDPARPTTLMRRIGRHHARWEMMLLPGETAEEAAREENVWRMLSRWVRPSDGVLTRKAVYMFRSGVAQRWRRGAVLLAGDAAHLMPPFLGQGLCSGLRDANALGWRLDMILSGRADASLLDSYEPERTLHVQGVIERAVAMGKVVCVTDPAEAERRDREILSGIAPELPPMPDLATGLLRRGAAGQPMRPAGLLGPQAPVRAGERTGRFDDLFGPFRWQLLLAPHAELPTPAQLAWLEGIGAVVVRLGSDVEDIEGHYAEFFGQHRVGAVLQRPDFYVFGAAHSAGDVHALIDALAAALALHGEAATSSPRIPA